MNDTVLTWLKNQGACKDAVKWAQEQKSSAQAWRDCQRGDWMLWLLGKLSGEPESAKRKPLVLAACKCARLSLKYVPKGEERPGVAIETAERWARGKATTEEVRAATAASAAAAYAYAAYSASAAAFADAAFYASASAASAAASAAAYAAAYAAAARKKTLARCADIVRKHYPKPPRTGGKQ